MEPYSYQRQLVTQDTMNISKATYKDGLAWILSFFCLGNGKYPKSGSFFQRTESCFSHIFFFKMLSMSKQILTSNQLQRATIFSNFYITCSKNFKQFQKPSPGC